LKLAIVIPWFGRELKGGAEQLAWQMATRLAKRGHAVDVLTTCCRSHQDDWATNHLAPGPAKEPEGFVVRRFLVDPRDETAFNRVCSKLQSIPLEALRPGVSPVDSSEADVFVNELIRSRSLIEYVTAEREAYQSFVLLPYLYGPVIHGALILQDRAVLQPCLHNESYAYLPRISQAFHAVNKLLFNSEGEKELALQLFGPGIWRKSRVVGSGIEQSANLEFAANGSAQSKSNGRFVLYLGRKDRGKNVPLLLRAFQRFKRVRPNSNLNLVFAGHGALETNDCNSIVDAGLVSESEKADLLNHCVALAQPSSNESFSRVMMEAWQYGRPVAVQASCLATATAVRRSGGGWLAETEDDWAELFTAINRMSPVELNERGRKGLEYAKDIADWDRVIERYEEAFASSPTTGTKSKAGPIATREIHQVLPNLSDGDAISNQALFIRDTLRAEGYTSNIYVRQPGPGVCHECSIYRPSEIPESAAIIYHHSIGSDLTEHLTKHRGPKFLIYHNITPDIFFERYRPEFALILRAGRDEMHDLARYFPESAGDSGFNRNELASYGFRNPSLLPIAVDPARWHSPPDPEIMSQLQDGRTNILFVGRIAPNKKHDDLIEAFEIYLLTDRWARLILPGPSDADDPYVSYIQDLIGNKRLSESAILAGDVDDAQLAAYYRCAHLFWSMSEHEGFGVPLVEAMWFDVPVLAFKSSAVPETLGNAGLMFTSKTSVGSMAALAHLLVKDVPLRAKVIAAQRQRREAFLPENVVPRILEIASRLQAAAGGYA
jgi:glycosyltransferase involved in cell wall biosynthesis